MVKCNRLQPGESREAGRRLVLPKRIAGWSLTCLQQRLVKTGGRLVETCPLLLAAVAGEPSDAAALWIPLCGMGRIAALPLPTG